MKPAGAHSLMTTARTRLPGGRARVWLLLGVGVLLVALGAGCGMVHRVATVGGSTTQAVTHGKEDKPAVDPVELQQTLMRFADEFSARVIVSSEKLRRGGKPLDRVELLRWKIIAGSQAWSIASGPNAFANLLDMTVFVTLTRMTVEQQWEPRGYGESAAPMLETTRATEAEIWRIAATVLNPEQQAELRKAIEEWRAQNPDPAAVVYGRAVGLAAQLTKESQPGLNPLGSVFQLLMLDPLSGLDPATREIAQTRLWGDRALYVAQRMPSMLRWQAELLSFNTADLPEVQQLLANSTQLAASLERFTRVAEQLPKQASTERETILEAVQSEREAILKALQSEGKNLTALASQVKEGLTAGSQMAVNLDNAIKTFDTMMAHLKSGPPSKEDSAPFRIQDYTQAAAQIETASQKLTDLFRTFDQTVGSPNLAKAQAGGKEVVDYAFEQAVRLIAIGCGAVFVTLLIYRIVGARLARARDKAEKGRE